MADSYSAIDAGDARLHHGSWIVDHGSWIMDHVAALAQGSEVARPIGAGIMV